MPVCMCMAQLRRGMRCSDMHALLMPIYILCIVVGSSASLGSKPRPPVWPETFHALAVQDRNGSLALVDLYYEWSKGRNANLIHKQLGTTLFDIE